MDTNKIAMLMAEKVREIATRQENIPFLTGDLRKSIKAQIIRQGVASVGSNLSYARAVHDGRGPITIRPKNKKALYWKGAKRPVKVVNQPARKGRPFLKNAMLEMVKDLSFLTPYVRKEVIDQIKNGIKFK